MTATMFEPDLSLDVDSMTREERVEALLAVDKMRSAAEALELRLVGSFAVNEDYAPDGAINAGLWMRRRLDMTGATANAMVRDAVKLRRHPESMDACTEIGTAKVRELIRRVNPRIEDTFTEQETDLLGWLRRFFVDEATIFAKRWAMLADDSGAEPPEQKQSVAMGRSGDALHGSFTLYGEDAALFNTALDRESDAIYRTEGEAGHLEPTERRAQALMNLMRVAVGAAHNTDPAKPAFIVHMKLEDLEKRAGHRLGEIDPFGPLSTLAVERLLCDAEVHRVIRDAKDAVINFGRSERLAKGFQRLAVIARDRHCTFPGCDRPPCMCEAHHLDPWDPVGETDMENLTLLCSRHHHACHEGGFTAQRLDDGALQFRRPDGTILHQPKPG